MGAGQGLILFDGVCNFCNFWVRFLIRRDPERRFRFAPLQSAAGAQALRRAGLSAGEMTTMIYLEGERAFVKSSAALRIARRMRGPWPLLLAFVVVPAPVRDLIYGWIARNRYRWFGKRDACRAPSPEDRERFLE